MIKKIALFILGIFYSCAVSYIPTLFFEAMWLKVGVFVLAQLMIWILLGEFFLTGSDDL